ncbi:MAG: YveK family protein [Candidatus Promineifilaceae bacterium]|jgi:capsular polysaccharide biosynthesis protein
MQLGDYVRILRRKGWIILLVAILTALAAFGFSKMQTEVYKSTLNLLVRPSRTDFGQSQAAKELLKTYEVWLYSSYRAQAVIDELQLDMTAQELLGDVEVASDNYSFMVSLAVENTDPNLANDIARTWGNQLIQWQIAENDKNRQEDRITIEFRDDPQVSLDRPNTKINTLAAFVFGALIGVIVIFLLEWLESGVIQRGEDVERYLEIPVIGTIPQE